MSGVVEPRILFGALGAVVGIVCVLVLFMLVRYLLVHLRPGSTRSARVSALAASGASRAEIARRTGLSQDAIGMLLRSRPGAHGRPNLPGAARTAAAATPRRQPATSDVFSQMAAAHAFAGYSRQRPGSAHRLLDGVVRSMRFSRERRMA